MNTPSSNEKLGHDQYINALTDLNREDADKHKEIFDLLKDKKIGPDEFTAKTQERDDEFRKKYADIINRAL